MSPAPTSAGSARVEEIVAEFSRAAIDHQDPQLATLLRAIFLEDAFDLTLSDDELAPDQLAGIDQARRIANRSR